MNKHNCHLNNLSKYVLGLSINIVLLKTLLMAVYSMYSNQIDIKINHITYQVTVFRAIRIQLCIGDLMLSIRKTSYHLKILVSTYMNTEKSENATPELFFIDLQCETTQQSNYKCILISKIVSEYDQEIPQSHTADKPMTS